MSLLNKTSIFHYQRLCHGVLSPKTALLVDLKEQTIESLDSSTPHWSVHEGFWRDADLEPANERFDAYRLVLRKELEKMGVVFQTEFQRTT